MNKGFGAAFGFLLVVLVVALGYYVAFTTFRSTRAALLAQPTSTPRPITPTRPPTRMPTSTETAIPTPSLGLTLTQTVAPEASPTATSEGATPTQAPAATATPVPTPSPTSPPVSSYAFRLAGPPAPESQSGCCYILGTVRDAAGNGLEGVAVQAYNEWTRLPPALTKGGADLGKYDIPIGVDRVTWYVVVVDASGKPISPQASLVFDVGAAPAVRVDWRRTH